MFRTIATATVLATVVVAFAYCGYCQIASKPVLNREMRTVEQKVTPDSVTRLLRVVPALIEGEQEIASSEFEIRNHFERTIELTGIRKSCACADAALDRKRLEPGETATLKMTVRLIGKSGRQKISCSVDEADGYSWNCELEVTIYPQDKFSPNSLHFGKVGAGQKCEREVIFESVARTRVQVENRVQFDCESTSITLKPQAEKVEQNPDGLWRRTVAVRLELQAPDSTGIGVATLTASSRFAPGEVKKTDSMIVWLVPEEYKLTPSQLYLSRAEIEAGMPIRKTVRIQREDGAEFQIEKVTVPTQAIRGYKPVGKATVSIVNFDIDPTRIGKFRFGDVEIECRTEVSRKLKLIFAAAGE